MLEACGKRVFVIDEGEGGGTPLLVVHGFPTSSYDFQHVWPQLTARRRVVALDLPGYGFSEKPADYNYSLLEQADVVEVVARQLGLEKVHLWGHDMGTSVATELLARRQNGLLHFELDRLILMNGSVHAEMAHLTPSQKLLLRPRLGPFFAKIASRPTYRWQLKRILSRPVADEELDDQYSLLRSDDGYLRLPRMHPLLRRTHPLPPALDRRPRKARPPGPDPLGRKRPGRRHRHRRAARPRNTGAKLVRLAGVGHYPQLEAPAEVVAQLELFLT